MARYFHVHPENPQPRAVAQVADILRDGGVIAYPTDSGFALGCRMGNREAVLRIRQIRGLDDKHDLTLVVGKFAQLGAWVVMNNSVFRAIKAVTPGPFTFVLRATREVPKAMVHPRKRTIGVRVPDHITALELLSALGEPIISTSLILPGETEPMTDGWAVKEELDAVIDGVLDSGDVVDRPTTVIDFTGDEPEVLRLGAGDPDRVL